MVWVLSSEYSKVQGAVFLLKATMDLKWLFIGVPQKAQKVTVQRLYVRYTQAMQSGVSGANSMTKVKWSSCYEAWQGLCYFMILANASRWMQQK